MSTHYKFNTSPSTESQKYTVKEGYTRKQVTVNTPGIVIEPVSPELEAGQQNRNTVSFCFAVSYSERRGIRILGYGVLVMEYINYYHSFYTTKK